MKADNDIISDSDRHINGGAGARLQRARCGRLANSEVSDDESDQRCAVGDNPFEKLAGACLDVFIACCTTVE